MKKIFNILVLSLVFTSSVSLLADDTGADKKNSEIYSRALMYKASKNYTAALKEFQKLENSEVDKHKIYFHIAECYFLLKDPVKAEENALKSVEAKRSYEPPYYILIRARFQLKRYRRSADAAEEVLFYYPDNMQYHYFAAYIYFSAVKNYRLTVVHLEKVLELASVQSIKGDFLEQVHLILAQSYFQLKEYDNSLHHLEYALSHNKVNNVRVLNMTNQLLERSLYVEAVKSFDMFFHYSPHNDSYLVRYHALQGRLMYLQGNYKAMTHLRKGMAAPGYEGKLSSALFWQLTGQVEKAEPLLIDILSKNSAITSAHLALAEIYSEKNPEKAYDHYVAAGLDLKKTNFRNSAISIFNKAIKIAGDAPVLHYYISDIYEKNQNYSMAVLHLKKAFEGKLKVPQLIHISYLHYLNKDNISANKYLDNAEKVDAGDYRISFWRGILSLSEKQYQQSIKYFNTSTDMEEKAETFYYLAIAYDSLKKEEKAVLSLEKAIKMRSDEPDYLNYLGYIYAKQGKNLDRAEEMIIKALKAEPENGAYLDSLGWVYYQQGKYEEALIYLFRAKTVLESENENIDPEIYDHLGDLYLKLNDKKLALYYYNLALKNNSDERIKEKVKKLQEGNDK